MLDACELGECITTSKHTLLHICHYHTKKDTPTNIDMIIIRHGDVILTLNF